MGAAAVVAGATPSLAQAVGAGAQATPLVGSGIVANCPPGSPGAVTGGTFTSNGVTVSGPAGAQCTPLDATTSGEYAVAAVPVAGLRFNSTCATDSTTGTVVTNGFVDVPAGTIVNGTAVATTTSITTLNTPVTFPGGRTAIVNQVITTPTSVTRNAIVFTGGPTVGQVVCGAPVYPLAVDAGAAGGAAPLVAHPISAGGHSSGPSAALVLVAGGLLLAVLAQLTVGRRLRRRGGDATS